MPTPSPQAISAIAKYGKLLLAKPSDAQMRLVGVCFTLVIFALIWCGADQYTVGVPASLASHPQVGLIVLTVLSCLALLPLVHAITGMRWLTSTLIKKLYGVYGVILFIVGTFWIQEAITLPSNTTTPLSYEQITSMPSSKPTVDVGFWIALLGWIVLIAGLTGKLSPESSRLVGVKLTKIRV